MYQKLLFIILVLHGLIHLYGFFNEWNAKEIKPIAWKRVFLKSNELVKVLSLLWVFVCLLLLLSSYGLVFEHIWWKFTALVGITLSQFLIVIYWRYAFFGTVANACVLLGILAL